MRCSICDKEQGEGAIIEIYEYEGRFTMGCICSLECKNKLEEQSKKILFSEGERK